MTIAMPDSVSVADLPDGYDAYLGYTDGRFATAMTLRARFPAAELVLLTVTGEAPGATVHGARVSLGTDAEPGDLNAASAARWAAAEKLGEFPVIYASVQGAAGFGMHDVLAELAAAGIGRDEVRLLSAHYGSGPHICGPASCRLIDTEMDGTQWTSQFETAGMSGATSFVDMSMLADNFFGLPQSETERLVTELGTVRQGMIGEAVRTVQGLCCARLGTLKVDGLFGPVTVTAVRTIQGRAHITADGIVGPQTWAVLLGVA